MLKREERTRETNKEEREMTCDNTGTGNAQGKCCRGTRVNVYQEMVGHNCSEFFVNISKTWLYMTYFITGVFSTGEGLWIGKFF